MILAPTTKVTSYAAQLQVRSHVVLPLLGGSAAAIVGAMLWAVFTLKTGIHLGVMAIAVALLVSYTVRALSPRSAATAGLIGAGLSLVGCFLGSFFTTTAILADYQSVNFFEALSLVDITVIPDLMIYTFQAVDLLFYAIAVYVGYRLSFRQPV